MRDYQKENEWHKKKYTRVLADIDKELASKFKNKLKEEGKSTASWITEEIKKYLKKI